jgi:hypothetical protein
VNKRLATLVLWATLLAVSMPAFFARKTRAEDVVLDRRCPAAVRLEAWKKLEPERGRELGRKLISDPSEDVELRRALEALTSSPPGPGR